MPLNILVLAVPEEARSTAEWLRRMAGPTESGTDEVRSVRTNSESDWQGRAGDLARKRLSEVAQRGDDVVTYMRAFADALEVYADGMETVHRRMHDARAVATRGGLIVTDTEIHEPPYSTADPGEGGPGHSVIENRPDHEAKVAARQAKIDAYREAGQHVTSGRDIQLNTESELEKFLSSQLEKSWITAPTTIAGWAGAKFDATDAWRELAKKNASIAAAAEKHLFDPLVPAQTRKELIGVYAKYKVDSQHIPPGSAADSKSARAIAKLPRSMRWVLKSGVGKDFRVSGFGTALTLASVADDALRGKDMGKSIGSNAVGNTAAVLAGGAVGLMGGGAVLTAGVPLVVGTVVSTGSGYVYDGIASGDSPSWTTENGQYRTPPMSR